MTIFPILYCTSHDCSLTTNLYFLIPSTVLPILPTPLPSGNHQNVFCIYEPVSVLLVHCFFLLLLLLFSYSCPTFFPIAQPYPVPTPTVNSPIVHAHESSIHVPLLVPSRFLPLYPPPSPLWSLSVCSLFSSL